MPCRARHRPLLIAVLVAGLACTVWAAPANASPNDTGAATRTATAGGWAGAQWDLTGRFGINAPAAWRAARDAPGAGVVVAVLDTGLAYENRSPYRRSPDISPAHVVPGYDFVDHDRHPDDSQGHGTFAASTIIATPNNRYGMVGVAYGAMVMPIRVLDRDGHGSPARIARGMRYAVDHGADVISMSIELFDTRNGTPRSMTFDGRVRAAVRHAAAHGVVVVAAAGNQASRTVPSQLLGGDIVYVGATTEHGCLASYSNFGPGVDLVAPGGGADAAGSRGSRCHAHGRAGRPVAQVSVQRPRLTRFRTMRGQGTSFAAPHVAGVVALLLGSRALGAHPSPQAAQHRLIATARDLGRAAGRRRDGAGLVDAAAALRGT